MLPKQLAIRRIFNVVRKAAFRRDVPFSTQVVLVGVVDGKHKMYGRGRLRKLTR